LEILKTYGAEAQRVVPQLKETATEWDKGEVDFPKQLSKRKAKAIREAIEFIQASTDRPELKRLK
jgi:hypothetical protein